MDSLTLVSTMLVFCSLIHHHSQAKPCLSDVLDSVHISPVDGQSSQDDLIGTDHLQLLNVPQENHVGDSLSEMYEPMSCNTINKDWYPTPTRANSTLVCPYTFVCREYDSNTYPNVVFEAKCDTNIDTRFHTFVCRETTVTEIAWKMSENTNIAGSTKWIPFERERKVACVADGVAEGKKALDEKYKTMYKFTYCQSDGCR